MVAGILPSIENLKCDSVLTVENEKQAANEFIIYPDPVSDYLYFRTNSRRQITSIEIKDITGKTLSEHKEFTGGIDVRHLRKGLYLLNIHTESSCQIKKFLKS